MRDGQVELEDEGGPEGVEGEKEEVESECDEEVEREEEYGNEAMDLEVPCFEGLETEELGDGDDAQLYYDSNSDDDDPVQGSVLPVAKYLADGQEPTDGSEYLLMVRRQAAAIPSILIKSSTTKSLHAAAPQSEATTLNTLETEERSDEDQKTRFLPRRGPAYPQWQKSVHEKLQMLRAIYGAADAPRLDLADQRLLAEAQNRHWDVYFEQLTRGRFALPDSLSTARPIPDGVPVSASPKVASSIFPEPITIDGRDVNGRAVSASLLQTSRIPVALLKTFTKAHKLSMIAYLTKRLSFIFDIILLRSSKASESKRELTDQAEFIMATILSTLLFVEPSGQLHAQDVSCLRDYGRILQRYLTLVDTGTSINDSLEYLACASAVAIGGIWGQLDLFEMYHINLL